MQIKDSIDNKDFKTLFGEISYSNPIEYADKLNKTDSVKCIQLAIKKVKSAFTDDEIIILDKALSKI